MLSQLCVLLMISLGQAISSNLTFFDVQLMEAGSSRYIYKDGKLQQKFDLDYLHHGQSCTPPVQVTVETKNGVATQVILVTNTGPLTFSRTSEDVYVTDGSNSENPEDSIQAEITTNSTSTTLSPFSDQYFQVNLTCPLKLTRDNYWAQISVQLQYNDTINLEFQYEFTCDPAFREAQFDWSILILILASYICVTALAQFSKIYSFVYRYSRNEGGDPHYFQGFELNIWMLMVYLSIYFTVGMLCIFAPDFMKYASMPFMVAIGGFALFFIMNEVFCSFSASGTLLVRHLFWKIRPCDIASLLIGLGIALGYVLTKKAWELSNLISLAIMGSSVKLFKIRSYRSALIFLLPSCAFDVIMAVISHIKYPESYNILVLQYFNLPLELETPLFKEQFDKKCAWISIISVVLPGFFIGFCYRMDRNKGGYIYTIMSLVGLLIGSTIWMAIQSQNPHSWPQSIFIYPTMLGVTALWAQKRGELKTMWEGSFYDQFLEKNYRSKSFFEKTLSGEQLQNIMIKSDHNKMIIDKSVFQGLQLQEDDNKNDIISPMLESSLIINNNRMSHSDL